MAKKCLGCGSRSGEGHLDSCSIAFKPRHQTHAADLVRKRVAIEAQEERKKRELIKLRSAVDAMLRSEAGQIVWVHLFHLCGYNQSSLVRRSDGELAPLATEAQEAQRLVYLKLRSLASRGLLVKVEDDAESAMEETTKEEKL